MATTGRGHLPLAEKQENTITQCWSGCEDVTCNRDAPESTSVYEKRDLWTNKEARTGSPTHRAYLRVIKTTLESMSSRLISPSAATLWRRDRLVCIQLRLSAERWVATGCTAAASTGGRGKTPESQFSIETEGWGQLHRLGGRMEQTLWTPFTPGNKMSFISKLYPDLICQIQCPRWDPDVSHSQSCITVFDAFQFVWTPLLYQHLFSMWSRCVPDLWPRDGLANWITICLSIRVFTFKLSYHIVISKWANVVLLGGSLGFVSFFTCGKSHTWQLEANIPWCNARLSWDTTGSLLILS